MPVIAVLERPVCAIAQYPPPGPHSTAFLRDSPSELQSVVSLVYYGCHQTVGVGKNCTMTPPPPQTTKKKTKKKRLLPRPQTLNGRNLENKADKIKVSKKNKKLCDFKG